MKLKLQIAEIKQDKEWVDARCKHDHYLESTAHPRSRPLRYVLKCEDSKPSRGGNNVGLCITTIPHATKNRLWWGYEGQPTNWQVIDLARIWLSPTIQMGGSMCNRRNVPGFVDRKDVFRPTTATWLIKEVLERSQKDRVSYWPPVYLDEPYHIRLAISYSDPEYHNGHIYQLAGASPMYQKPNGKIKLSSRGKAGWVWRLPKPSWSWHEIYIEKPRTMRLF